MINLMNKNMNYLYEAIGKLHLDVVSIEIAVEDEIFINAGSEHIRISKSRNGEVVTEIDCTYLSSEDLDLIAMISKIAKELME